MRLGTRVCTIVIFLPLIFCTRGNLLSDIYFEVDNDDAVMENIMGDDKIAVTILLLFFYLKVNNSVIILHSSIPKKNSSLHEKVNYVLLCLVACAYT